MAETFRYQCDWTYARSPRCTTVIEVPEQPTEPLGRHFFLCGKPFRDAGWTIGTGANKGKTFCRLHRDTLLCRMMRGEKPTSAEHRKIFGLKAKLDAHAANLARIRQDLAKLKEPQPVVQPGRIPGQGMTRPSMDPQFPASTTFSQKMLKGGRDRS